MTGSPELGTPRRKQSSQRSTRRAPAPRHPAPPTPPPSPEHAVSSASLLSKLASLLAAFLAAPKLSPAETATARELTAQLAVLLCEPINQKHSLEVLPPDLLAHVVSMCSSPEDISRLDTVSHSFHGQRRYRSVVEEGLRLRAAGRSLPSYLASGEHSWVQKLCWDEVSHLPLS